MTSQPAKIVGRILGPDGSGRLGRLTVTPTSCGSCLPAQDIVAGRVSARLDTDGRLVGPDGDFLEIGSGLYALDLNIPGDLGIHVRAVVLLAEGSTFDIAKLPDLAPPLPPQPDPGPLPDDGLVHSDGRNVRVSEIPGVLVAQSPAVVKDLGGGLLTWAATPEEAGIIAAGGRNVRTTHETGVLAAESGAVVRPAGNGALAWA
uniref:Uncharacterized protein n=1 Tax=Dulem virus 38 TaxID=3145756 RepID=A0AAU8B0I7_9CAUD